MKTAVKALLTLVLSAVVCCVGGLPCLAADSGSIAITLEDKDKNYINGTTVYIAQVAELNNAGYFPTASFEDSGISISGIVNNPDAEAAATLADYVWEHRVPTELAVSQEGRIVFNELSLGIWVVFCDQNCPYTFSPFVVILPTLTGGKLNYDIHSTPKMQENKPDVTSVYVIKKWDDRKDAANKRPDMITVELLDGRTVKDKVELSENNGWSHTFTNLPADGHYSVREKKVTGYQATYGGDAKNGFIITNTYAGEKLPQTGQYWWPIVILAVAGACFLLLGILEMRSKKHGEKKH